MLKTLITSRDPLGLQFINLCETTYNKAKLDGDRAQRLNERGSELQEGLKRLISELTNKFRVEEATFYPEGYRVKSLHAQIDLLAKIFKLSLVETIEFIEKVLPELDLPEGAEGWFAIPSVDAVAKRFFPEVNDAGERYCKAVQLVLDKIKASRKFHNYRKGRIDPDHLRLHSRTAQMLDLIVKQQKGDILIVPAQFGNRHAGRSVRRAREVFIANEFGAGSFMTGSMLLTHPERLVSYDDLWIDCPGDEFAPGADGDFNGVPYFNFRCGRVRFRTSGVGSFYVNYGSASGFLPQ